MGEGFVDRFVGVLELDVFADDGDLDLVGRVDDPVDECFPFVELRGRGVAEAELVADEPVELVAPQVERAFVDRVFDIAEPDDARFSTLQNIAILRRLSSSLIAARCGRR